MKYTLPRYIIPKNLRSGVVAYYFNVPTVYRKAGCQVPNEPLGTDYVVACGADGKGGRAATLNGLFDEWNNARRGLPVRLAIAHASVAPPAVVAPRTPTSPPSALKRAAFS